MLAGEGITSRVFQKGHMEYWVDPHGVREAEVDGIRRAQAGVGNHLERAEPSVV